MQCLLIGNFGVGNLGDEALKEFFLTEFPEVDWLTVSARPKGDKELPRLPVGLRSLLSFRWVSTFRAYAKCDAVVYGGGSLFTDVESVSACVIWWIHSLPARALGKPVHLAFQGIGPFKKRVGERLTRSVLRSAATISVRDEASGNRIKKMDKSIKFVQSCDPVIWLIKKQKCNIRTENLLTLIPRKNSSEKFTKAAQEFAESRGWGEIRVISMEPDNMTERAYVKQLALILGHSAAVHTVRTLPELLSHIAPAAQVVSERYHGALPAVMFGKPVEIISQSDGDKLSTLRPGSINIPGCTSAIEMLRAAMY